jgi:hypothetical protein
LAKLAAELVALGPDAIVTVATPPALAAKRAMSTIPIVMADVADPLRAGIVASLARPGGNITGVTLCAMYRSELCAVRSRRRPVFRIFAEIPRGRPTES